VLVLQDLFEVLLPVEQHQVARNQEEQEGSEHRLPAAAAGCRCAGGKGGGRRSDWWGSHQDAPVRRRAHPRIPTLPRTTGRGVPLCQAHARSVPG